MDVGVSGNGLNVDGALRDAVSRRLSTVLHRFGSRVQWVDVRFTDVNGPRGGVDTRCRVEASIHPLGSIVADETHETALQAIREASDKVARSAARRLERLRERRRRLAAG